ncbi:MAG: sigma-70 family RNA polymerase sigma factor [Actinobacteria bacterium]|nr:sigma-70 family RNA polymerase sigma factor [Actinomycetota bacterium]
MLSLRRDDDHELARRVCAGDSAAFAVLDARHRGPLIRYAGSLVRRSEHDAEDIVQDVLIGVHEALRAGDQPDELRPWLYRLTRNRAINVVRRARFGEQELDSELVGSRDDRHEPDVALRRKDALRCLVDDLAALPERQRTALLARELDGHSAEHVAAQLNVTPAAAQMLAIRARENLVKTRAARDADCLEIRALLVDAHERGVRAPEHATRHVKGCDACRAYQRDVRSLSKQLQALNPSFGLGLLAGLAKLAGSGAGKLALGAGAALVIAVGGGVIVTAATQHDAGDPSPYRFTALGRPTVKTGGSIPNNMALVTARAQIPAGAPPAGQQRSVTLTCPPQMKYAGPSADTEQRADVPWNPSQNAVFGRSTRVRIEFVDDVMPRATATDVGILCVKPAPNGSLLAHPRLPKRGERAGRVCTRFEYIRPKPEAILSGRAERGQPLSIVRTSPSRHWTFVVLDTGRRGWIKTSALCH